MNILQKLLLIIKYALNGRGREGLESIKTEELYMRVRSVIFDFKLEERKYEKKNVSEKFIWREIMKYLR